MYIDNTINNITWDIYNISWKIINISGNIKDWALTIKINWTTWVVFSANTWVNTGINISIPQVFWNTGWYLCTYSWGNLDCTRAILWTMWGWEWLCVYDENSQRINCNQNHQWGWGDGSTWVFVNWNTTGFLCTRNGANTINCYTNQNIFANAAEFATLRTLVYNINDNYVTIQNVDQTINWTKTFIISPVVPNKTTIATDSGTAIATEYQVRTRHASQR